MKNVIYTVVAAALITNMVGAVFCVIGNCVPYDIKTLREQSPAALPS